MLPFGPGPMTVPPGVVGTPGAAEAAAVDLAPGTRLGAVVADVPGGGDGCSDAPTARLSPPPGSSWRSSYFTWPMDSRPVTSTTAAAMPTGRTRRSSTRPPRAPAQI